MGNSIIDKAREHILIAAHRGEAGGNIPCNSLSAFEIAVRHGADILEIDITKSLDGELFVFHPGKEKQFLNSRKRLEFMKAANIKKFRLHNADGCVTTDRILTLDEFCEHFKNRCIVNLDKFWGAIKEITACVRRHNMQEQVIAKSNPTKHNIDMLEEIAYDIPYIPFVSEKDVVTDRLLKKNICLIGSEAHFTSDDSEVASYEYIEKMHKKNLIVWVNAIVFNYKTMESANHTDDVSLLGNPDLGWGWLAKRGYDIIQTDWTMAMRKYLMEKGYIK